MASGSSFLSRLSRRGDKPSVLPLYTRHQRSLKPLHHKNSEHDLADLSPRVDEALLFSTNLNPNTDSEHASLTGHSRSSRHRSSFIRYDDDDDGDEHAPRTTPMSPSSRPTPQRVLFAGPPPPIATSTLLYRDIEDRTGHNDDAPSSSVLVGRRHPGGALLRNNGLSGSNRSTTSSPSKPRGVPRDADAAAWAFLQRRERALQQDIQTLLDIQSAGLAAGLGRDSGGSGSNEPGIGGMGASVSSHSSTPTATTYSLTYATTPFPPGAVIPVRQPRPRKLGLRGARAGLARSITLLADLKGEEDTLLAGALNARRQALAHLDALTGRRRAIVGALSALETGDNMDGDGGPAAETAVETAAGPGAELATLRTAHHSTTQQIAKLEGQLAMLRARKRTLEARIDHAQSRREAERSGYRGALREVDAQLAAVLRQPPVQPLGYGGGEDGDNGGVGRNSEEDDSTTATPGGDEFLQLRPERRTADMARSWWEAEARLLEQRQQAIARERMALEEGGAVWRASAQLVTSFEDGLRRELATDGKEGVEEGNGKEKGRTCRPTPEDMMRRQLRQMTDVAAGLREHLQTAEEHGWNLLLCAIGAELEAFEEARGMLLEALHEAGELEEAGGDFETKGEAAAATPRLAQSTSDALTFQTAASGASSLRGSVIVPATAEARDGGKQMAYAQSDDTNDVPSALLIVHDEEREDPAEVRQGATAADQAGGPKDHDDDSSENNDVPPEFFSEHDGR